MFATVKDTDGRLMLQEVEDVKINNCKWCNGYGYVTYFDGGGSSETQRCRACKAKPSLKVRCSEKGEG